MKSKCCNAPFKQDNIVYKCEKCGKICEAVEGLENNINTLTKEDLLLYIKINELINGSNWFTAETKKEWHYYYKDSLTFIDKVKAIWRFLKFLFIED